jgi:hypothetical protein
VCGEIKILQKEKEISIDLQLVSVLPHLTSSQPHMRKKKIPEFPGNYMHMTTF